MINAGKPKEEGNRRHFPPSKTEAAMDNLYIVIPAYNEEENIAQVIEDWYPVIRAHDGGGASRLVIIDDGSRDATFSILQEAAHGADYVFQTDSDGQTLPEEFEPFWAQRETYDMVIGWRKERQDGASRVFVTKTLKAVIKACFGVTVKDANTPFRLMKADTMRKYIDLIPKDFNLSNVLLSVIYEKKGCSVHYIPITFRPRQGGVNSINMKKIFKIGEQALSDFRKLNEVISKE